MKGLKQLALAAAVVAPFAQAEMASIDDVMLSEMTGQAGITIDVDLAMTIDAIKYVDQDGLTGQGAITMKSIKVGSIDAATGTLSAAQIRGITIDADATKGLVIGLEQIGDTAGNGIDIQVGAVLINNGYADADILTALDDGALAPAASGPAGAGNIGGFVINNFRNFIQDELVHKYNGVFGMALNDSTGVSTRTVGTSTDGRYVRGEIQIQGTGNALTGTAGLKITAAFGGALDKAAWVDTDAAATTIGGGRQFGIKDIGFFKGVDTNGDTFKDTIEALAFSVNVDVVDHATWNGAGATTAALALSGMNVDGTIMLGDIFLSNNDGTGATSLGSVLIKDINMTNTTMYVYGH